MREDCHWRAHVRIYIYECKRLMLRVVASARRCIMVTVRVRWHILYAAICDENGFSMNWRCLELKCFILFCFIFNLYMEFLSHSTCQISA